jgi:TPR repeat protein
LNEGLLEEARTLFAAAFQHDPGVGACEYAQMLLDEGKTAQAGEVLRKGVAAESSQAAAMLGKLLRTKKLPEIVPNEAVSVLSPASQRTGRHGACAAYELGKLYFKSLQESEGVQFLRLFERAHERRLAKATKMLARCYREGRGCTKDLAKAQEYEEIATQRQQAEAAGLAVLHRTMSGPMRPPGT